MQAKTKYYGKTKKKEKKNYATSLIRRTLAILLLAVMLSAASPIYANATDLLAFPAYAANSITESNDIIYFESDEEIYLTMQELLRASTPVFTIACPTDKLTKDYAGLYYEAIYKDRGDTRWNIMHASPSYVMKNGYTYIKYAITYRMTDNQAAWARSYANELVKSLEVDGLNDFDIIEKFREYILRNWDYDTTLENNTPYLMFTNKTGTCLGHVSAMIMMCDVVGIETQTVTGELDGASGLPHIRLLVKLNGEWYETDPTLYAFGIKYHLNNKFVEFKPKAEYDNEWFHENFPFAQIPYTTVLTAANKYGTHIDKAFKEGLLPAQFVAKLGETATRAETVALIVNAVERAMNEELETGEASFEDIDGNEYLVAIEKAVNAGLISGVSEGKFVPGNTVNKETFAVILARMYRMLGFKNAVTSKTFNDVSSWATNDVGLITGLGFMSGKSDNTFGARDTMALSDCVDALVKFFA